MLTSLRAQGDVWEMSLDGPKWLRALSRTESHSTIMTQKLQLNMKHFNERTNNVEIQTAIEAR